MAYVKGVWNWRLGRDAEGHREYKVTFLVITEDPFDGPLTVLNTPGLPIVGDPYILGNDLDNWAYCKPSCNVSPVQQKEPCTWWEAEFTFSTKYDDKRCKDSNIEDPLLTPDRISGGFTKYQEEAATDYFGSPITSSSHEQIRGAQVEFDKNRPTVKIVQNRVNLELDLISQLIDVLNDAPLWGLAQRCVKLSNVSWERKFYARCYMYYERTLEFELRYEGFDRVLLDEGSKVLNGRWNDSDGSWTLVAVPGSSDTPNPNPNNPTHFMKMIDRAGNPMRVILDGAGKPSGILVTSGSYNLSGSVTPTDTTIIVNTAANKKGAFVIKIGDEYLRVLSGGLTTTWRVQRGYAGSKAVQHENASAITIVENNPGGQIPLYKYPMGNLLLLGIPTDLNTTI